LRVALCLSGLTRAVWRECFEYNRTRLLENLRPDVFFSSWADDEATFLEFRECARAHSCKLADNEIHYLSWVNAQHDILIKDHPDLATERTTYWPMMHSIYKCNILKSIYEAVHGFKYDMVVRVRTDALYEDIPPKCIDAVMKNKDTVFAPLFPRIGYLDYTPINDCLAIGTSEAMDVYSRAFLHIVPALRSLKSRVSVPLSNEAIMCECLKLAGAKYEVCHGLSVVVHTMRLGYLCP
jgi:hypothetical protein